MAAFCPVARRSSYFSLSFLLLACSGVLVLGLPATSHAVDCNSNGVEDMADIVGGTSDDCDFNNVPDDCDISVGSASDCNTNGVPDECDVRTIVQIAKLTASDAIGGEEFGYSVSIDGDTALVGVQYGRAAYVIRKVSADWQEIAKLTVTHTPVHDGFGISVFISEDTVIVGAPIDDDGGEGSGAAYVFREVAGVWQEVAKLTASDAAAGDRFGERVAISGDTVVIGANLDDDGGADSGSAYVFREVAGVWQEIAKLTALDAAADDQFGVGVSVSGDTVVIGAYHDDDGGDASGSAYVFREVAGVWQQVSKLSASDAATNARFGASVSIDGNTAVVGAILGNSLRGAAYLFREEAGVWQQIARLTASDPGTFDLFGLSVSLSGDTAVVGASRGNDGGAESGSAYVFREISGVWRQVAKLNASDAEPDEMFGAGVAVSGGTAIIGAHQDDQEGILSGSAYVFDSPFDVNTNGVPDECDPDCNSNGVPDSVDIGEGSSTDCNANSVPDECDVAGGTSDDCSFNAVPDECELAAGSSNDCNINGILDECDVASGTSDDCNLNLVPDNCELAAGSATDCNTNGIQDDCDDTPFVQVAKLTASDEEQGDSFGRSVSISGNIAFIGAPGDDDIGFFSGAVYVYRGEAGAWQEVTKLLASDGAAGDGFGGSVSISGDMAIVGASSNDDGGMNSGSAYLFREVAGVWQEIAKLTALDDAAGDGFGVSVSICGATAMIGASGNGDFGADSGSAYVFREVAGVWQQIAKLTSSDISAGDRFGASVSISGDTAIVGAYRNDDGGTDSGSAYVFREVAGVWQEIAKLTASDAAAGDWFGNSVSLSGDAAAIGASGYDDEGYNIDSAYVFREIAGVWQEVAKLTASDAAAVVGSSPSVSIGGDTVVVGASFDDDGGHSSGSAYVFREIAGVWQEVAKLAASDAAQFDIFGNSVSLSGRIAVIGAPGFSEFNIGSAYVFDSFFDANSNGTADVCEPDCNTNGAPDDLDILGSVSVDCNTNGVPDECDIAGGTSDDCNLNSVPDDCEPDCNANGVADECDVAGVTSDDCNLNTIPDECDIAAGSASDCDFNGIPDSCDVSYFAQVAKLTASDAAAYDEFGVSVSISGDTAIIGAHIESINRGSAYLFRRVAGTWEQIAKLGANDGMLGDHFGESASLSGDTAAIGAPLDDDRGSNSGSVYVFRELAGVWQQVAKLTATDGVLGDQFGVSVSLSGNTVVIGMPFDDDAGTSSGSAYVFREVAGVWQQVAKLTASDGTAEDEFGQSVSISDDTIAIGARGDDDAGASSGSVYLFQEVAGVWQQIAKLTASDAAAEDQFGRSVSISQRAVVAGAWLDDDVADRSGSAYLFREIDGVWRQITKLTASDANAGYNFGVSVSISGDTAVIGAMGDNTSGTNRGSVYVFREVVGVWQEVAKLIASDVSWQAEFGVSVAVSGDTAVIGAWKDDAVGTDSGSAYVFDFPEVGVDCNANAVPDECDLISTLDFNADGAIDLADYAGFAVCLAGPEAAPASAATECNWICLDAFDSDQDGDVDLADAAAFQAGFEVSSR